jgi:hypothetical protein
VFVAMLAVIFAIVVAVVFCKLFAAMLSLSVVFAYLLLLSLL